MDPETGTCIPAGLAGYATVGVGFCRGPGGGDEFVNGRVRSVADLTVPANLTRPPDLAGTVGCRCHFKKTRLAVVVVISVVVVGVVAVAVADVLVLVRVAHYHHMIS